MSSKPLIVISLLCAACGAEPGPSPAAADAGFAAADATLAPDAAPSYSDAGSAGTDAATLRPDASAPLADAGSSGLPPPWSFAEAGPRGASGAAAGDGTTFTVSGTGADLGATTEDGFTFVYQPWTGDVVLTARVASLTNTHDYAKAGVMLRQSLDPDSPMGIALTWPALGTKAAWRTSAGAQAVAPGPTINDHPSTWLRLTRVQSSLTAAVSRDEGATWEQLGTQTLALTDPVLVGVAVASHDVTKTASAQFADLEVVPPSGDPDAVRVAPASPSVPPGGSMTFTASGGHGAYVWRFAQRGSGSPQLSATTGAAITYTAGATGGGVHDVVESCDAAAPTVCGQATVTVQ